MLLDIYTTVDVYAPEISDQIAAYELQRETLLYTTDCVLLALAEDIGATLVTFGKELLSAGAVEPSDALSSGDAAG